jgi:3-deoxy-7-phosphoheptulonate synthase
MKPPRRTLLLIRMRAGAGRDAGARLARRLKADIGPEPRCRWHSPTMLCILLERAADQAALAGLRRMAEVESVTTTPWDRPLASRSEPAADRSVRLPNGIRIGGGLAVIAGPCSVESAAQICETAARVREAGAAALRGGAFKSRTSPYSFAGLGEEGLEHLALAREKTGLPVVTEVVDTRDLDLVCRFADVLQIGSRSMQNFPLLFQAGSHPAGKPVLLKRGFSATVEEFLQAAEYVLLGQLFAGRQEPGLILCERGMRTACDATRFTLDLGSIAVLKEKTGLPVIADPSHAAGDRRYVARLALAAAAAGADGLMIEVHPDPDQAWSDGAQSLDARAFRELMGGLTCGRDDSSGWCWPGRGPRAGPPWPGRGARSAGKGSSEARKPRPRRPAGPRGLRRGS